MLIGKPVGTTPPGLRAFFFVDGEFIGHDASAPSGKLRPGRQLEREVTLVYTLYEPGDRACCPKGRDTRVHFRWTGEALEPREAIPPDAERLPPLLGCRRQARRRPAEAPSTGRSRRKPAGRRRGPVGSLSGGRRPSARAATRGALATADVLPAREPPVELRLVVRWASRRTLPPPRPPSACWNRYSSPVSWTYAARNVGPCCERQNRPTSRSRELRRAGSDA